MPKVVQDPSGLWSVISDDGAVIASSLSNSQAWRRADIAANEVGSASEYARRLKEPEPVVSEAEKQAFYSGLLWIADARGYSSGWAWHNFCDKFGHRPDGLHQGMVAPSKSVWGWVNRKAIPKKMQRRG